MAKFICIKRCLFRNTLCSVGQTIEMPSNFKSKFFKIVDEPTKSDSIKEIKNVLKPVEKKVEEPKEESVSDVIDQISKVSKSHKKV